MPVAGERKKQNERTDDQNAARFQPVDGMFSGTLRGRSHDSIVAPQLDVDASAALVRQLRLVHVGTVGNCSARAGRSRPHSFRNAKLSAAVSYPPSSPAGKTIRFGVFEVDLAAGELRKNGNRIRLQEQPFQILVYLLDRTGEVVTREELRQKLWPADTFVDFDHSLNTAVNKLREALGDSASSPRYVETLARRGYRFLAPVQRTEQKSQDSQPPSRRHSSRSDKPGGALPS